MLEFYYDFLDVYLEQKDFELIQMDTDSMYMALSGASIDELVKPTLREKYYTSEKAEFLSTSKYHDRTPGLFKAEFRGTRMIALTSKCYYAEDQETLKKKFSCKGVNKRQNEMDWELSWKPCMGVGTLQQTQASEFGIKESQPTLNIS